MVFLSHSAEQTRQLGVRLGNRLEVGDVICLQGDLGVGKTTLVQGIAQGWGSQDPVSSPTFIIVNVYRGQTEVPLYHMDAYRIDSVPEAAELDLDSMLAHGPLVIEWPERVKGLIPDECLWIRLDHAGMEERELTFRATGKRHKDLLEAVRDVAAGGG